MDYPIITWRGLTLGGEGGRYRIQSLEGWEDLPSVRSGDESRSRAHGDHSGQHLASGRTVTASGIFIDRDEVDGLFLALQAATPLRDANDLTQDELAITSRGRTLIASARLLRRSLPQDTDNNNGANAWALQWTAADPLRYGPERTASSGLPTDGGGLSYGLGYDLTYGDPGVPGSVVLSNEGTADAPAVFEVTGPLPAGFEIASVGGRITYFGEVAAGQKVVIDTAEGTALIEGTADRRGNLAWADWIQIPAGTALTVTFASLGGDYSATAQLFARYRPAYW